MREPDIRAQEQRRKKFDEVRGRLRQARDEVVQPVTAVQNDEAPDLDSLRAILDLWLEIFTSSLARKSFVEAPTVEDPAGGWLGWPKEETLERLTFHLKTAGAYAQFPTDAKSVDRMIERLSDELATTVDDARQTDLSFLQDDFGQRLKHEVDSVADRLDLLRRRQNIKLLHELARSAAETAEQSAADAGNAADATRTAAGLTSDVKLASFYKDLAYDERRSADRFRWLTVYLALLGAGISLAFVLGHGSSVAWLDIAPGDYVHLIQRAIVVAGAFGLAGYFARQAHQHRSMANWAGSLAVQLQTFDGYLAAIENPDVRDELRKTFALRVFGEHPPMKGEPTVTPSAAAMDTAVGWAAKLTAGGKQ